MNPFQQQLTKLLSELVIAVANKERENHKKHSGAGSFDIDTADYIYPTIEAILQLIESEIIGENFTNWGELETEEQRDKAIENNLRKAMLAKLRSKS